MAQTKYEYFEDLDRDRIRFRDFKGRGFEDSGDKPNIGIWLDDDEQVERMINDGWAVKFADLEGDRKRAYIKLKVYWPKNPEYAGPKIVLVTEGGRTVMTPETIGTLDSVDLLKIDIKAHWFLSQKGKTEYHCSSIDALYLTAREDRLERKYRMMQTVEDDEEVPFI